jgi:hypothetical protein
MPGLLRPNPQTGYIHAEAHDIDRQLREGDGILWPGDPRLFLSMGTLTAGRSGYSDQLGRYVHRGEVVARRYEVHRYCEDGNVELIGTWKVEDFGRILMDLAPLRLDAPGRQSTIDAIDEHNAKIAKDASAALKESMMEVLDHQVRLWHDRENPRNRFSMNDIIPPEKRQRLDEVRAAPGMREPAPKVAATTEA